MGRSDDVSKFPTEVPTDLLKQFDDAGNRLFRTRTDKVLYCMRWFVHEFKEKERVKFED